ncbi:hypothetical protein ACF3OC_11905 [Sphingobacterium cellulitidis]|uniref:hypothetical protein n=1 Tax=Sphingobacterium cellulitidis TaxID=1768011 RepID=UPI000B93EAB2|nr:hypothetical protein CHT99_08560 [Sphingobacterium cellulitidis]
MAFPLAINEIGSINSKYNSEKILEIFRRQFGWNVFYYTLIISLLLIAIYASGRVFGFTLRFNHLLIWSIFIISILLSVFLILFVNNVMTYKSDISLKKYLLEKDNNSYNFKDELLDLYIYFLKKDKSYTDHELWIYFSEYFSNIRKNNAVSDTDLQIINRLNSVVLDGTSMDYVLLQYNASAGEWLIGRHEYNGRIKQNIYSFIWNRLKQALSMDKSYILIKFWMIIYDYIDRIPTILPEQNEQGEIINQDSVNDSADEIQDLIDFATAMGGMLYYKNKLQDISTIFYYTQSQPPVYKAILPAKVRDCIKLYSNFYNGPVHRYSLLDTKYPFPDLVGINAESTIIGNILRFIVLEYLRLFTIPSTYYGFEPLDYTGLEEEHISNLLSFHDFFSERLAEFVADKDLCFRIFGLRTFSQDPVAYFDEIVRHYEVTNS